MMEIMDMDEESTRKLEEVGEIVVIRTKAELDNYIRNVVPKIKEEIEKERARNPQPPK